MRLQSLPSVIARHGLDARTRSLIKSRLRGLRGVHTRRLAIGALAVGAVAIGALAIGALAIGRLMVGRARIRRLSIGELDVGDLRVSGVLQTPQPIPVERVSTAEIAGR